jgi:hypothetical protein
MDWHITIGRYRVALLDSVKVRRSVEQLADTAEVVLPGMAFGSALDVESKLIRGDKVTVRLGYNDALVPEFEGWLQNISVNGGSITLQCEDDLFKFRVDVPDEELLSISAKQLCRHVIDAIGGGYSLDCDYDFDYDKFVIQRATGYDILKKIQEETLANIYLRDSTLHIHPAYTNIGQTVRYDFWQNVEKDDLTYKRADERKLEVHVESDSPDGKKIEAVAGSTGGDRFTMKVYGVSDIKSLQNLADEAYRQRVYNGYEGSIDGWLIPYIDAGWSVIIRDGDYPAREGKYFVTAVETTFSSGGGVRKIELGAKLK